MHQIPRWILVLDWTAPPLPTLEFGHSLHTGKKLSWMCNDNRIPTKLLYTRLGNLQIKFHPSLRSSRQERELPTMSHMHTENVEKTHAVGHQKGRTSKVFLREGYSVTTTRECGRQGEHSLI